MRRLPLAANMSLHIHILMHDENHSLNLMLTKLPFPHPSSLPCSRTCTLLLKQFWPFINCNLYIDVNNVRWKKQHEAYSKRGFHSYCAACKTGRVWTHCWFSIFWQYIHYFVTERASWKRMAKGNGTATGDRFHHLFLDSELMIHKPTTIWS